MPGLGANGPAVPLVGLLPPGAIDGGGIIGAPPPLMR